MKKRNGFTLVELLVVIAIIALLLSVLMPSLSKARGQAKKIVCGSLIRQMGLANITYASTHNGMIVGNPVPFDKAPRDMPMPYWCSNYDFLSAMGLKYKEITKAISNGGAYIWPKRYQCPSYVQSKRYPGVYYFGHQISYGLNYDVGGAVAQVLYGPTFQISNLKNPSNKIMFADAIDTWWIWSGGASYKDPVYGWDRVGNSFVNNGNVAFRHTEGTSIAYYDGHAGYSKKADTCKYAGTGTGAAARKPDRALNDQMWKLPFVN